MEYSKKINPVNYVTPKVLDILNNADGIDINSLTKFKTQRYNISGVYFLYQKNILVYIGSSKDIFNRLEFHFKDNSKEYDSYSYLELPDLEYQLTERYLINKYLPIYNKDGITKKIRKTIL